MAQENLEALMERELDYADLTKQLDQILTNIDGQISKMRTEMREHYMTEYANELWVQIGGKEEERQKTATLINALKGLKFEQADPEAKKSITKIAACILYTLNNPSLSPTSLREVGVQINKLGQSLNNSGFKKFIDSICSALGIKEIYSTSKKEAQIKSFAQAKCSFFESMRYDSKHMEKIRGAVASKDTRDAPDTPPRNVQSSGPRK